MKVADKHKHTHRYDPRARVPEIRFNDTSSGFRECLTVTKLGANRLL